MMRQYVPETLQIRFNRDEFCGLSEIAAILPCKEKKGNEIHSLQWIFEMNNTNRPLSRSFHVSHIL